MTQLGYDFINEPFSIEVTEDHNYELNNTTTSLTQKNQAADSNLYNILKQIRKKLAKEINLPPAIIFSELSLIDMANQYPTSIEKMSKIQGVGIGKANKYGDRFIKEIQKYVEEHDIIRPEDFIIKSVANKSSNKIYIIQSLDKKFSLEDIAKK